MPAIPVPTVGQPILQTWGKSVADRVNGLQLLVKRSTEYSTITDAAYFTVPFDQVVTNVGNAWQAGSNGWRAPSAGLVEAHASIGFNISGGTIGPLVADFCIGSPTGLVARFGLMWLTTGAIAQWHAAGSGCFQVAANDLVLVAAYYGGAVGKTKSLLSGSYFGLRYIG